MSTEYPLTVPITLHRRTATKVDEYGYPVGGYTTEQILVFGVVVGGEDIPTQVNHDAVRYDLTVFAPVEANVSDRDRFQWAGLTYEVDGPPGDWNTNPWFKPGLVQCRCNKIEG